jgi:hypothetical protein
MIDKESRKDMEPLEVLLEKYNDWMERQSLL